MSVDKSLLKKLGESLLENPLMRMFDPNPGNHPSIVYKYRNWKDDFHKDLLIKGQLYMAEPSSLNDPFDCKIYDNYLKFVDSPEAKEQYILDSLEKSTDYFAENGISKEKARKILSERLSDTLHYQIRSQVTSEEIDDKHVGIACVSEKWNSILMWTHYADNHKGYCIGFDEKYLRYSQLFGKISRVTYSNIYPELNPLTKSKEERDIKHFYKSLEWEYEDEIRLMKLYFDYTTEKPDRIINLENKYIKEVILGLQISKIDKNEIIQIARDKDIKVFQATKGDFEFKIERYEV